MYDAICISGGGCKGVALLGLLYEWHVAGKLHNINTWCTCSVGGFIAVLVLTGLNPLQILSYFPKIDKITPSFDLVSSLFKKSGIMRIQKYTKKFCKQVEKFMGIENPTLAQFWEKTGKTLYISTVNKDLGEVVYFNHIDHPDVYLFDAIWASAAIPGFFIPIKINGHSFIDGGVYNSLPIEPVIDKKIVAFAFEDLKDGDMFYILRLASVIAKKNAIKRAKDIHLIVCHTRFDTLDFQKTKRQLLEEFDFGRSQFLSEDSE